MPVNRIVSIIVVVLILIALIMIGKKAKEPTSIKIESEESISEIITPQIKEPLPTQRPLDELIIPQKPQPKAAISKDEDVLSKDSGDEE